MTKSKQERSSRMIRIMTPSSLLFLLWSLVILSFTTLSSVEAAAVVSSTPSSSSSSSTTAPMRCQRQKYHHVGSSTRTMNCMNSNDTSQEEESLSIILGKEVENLKQMRGGGNDEDNNDNNTKDNGAMLEGIKNSLASAMAAGVSKAILAPFDTIKTMQQNYISTSAATSTSLGFWKAASLIMERPKGFMELYAGLGVAVVGSMPSVGQYFGVYSYCKRTLQPTFERLLASSTDDTKGQHNAALIRTLTIATSAAIGNTVASFSRVPYEVVKQKLQTGQYASTMEALTQMARTEGWRAFFPMGGVSIQMLRDIPYAMVTLLSYEYLRDTFIRSQQQSTGSSNASTGASTTTAKTTVWKDMAVGATAGGIGSYVTNPLDVIKTRIQTDPQLYNGNIGTCFAMTLEEGGPMAFLRGSIPRLLHKIPANGCFFVFYEFFRRVLRVEEYNHPKNNNVKTKKKSSNK